MKITKEEILKKCTWSYDNTATLQFDIPYLGVREIGLCPNENLKEDLSETMVQAFNELININVQQVEYIKDLLYRVFKTSCEATSYGDYNINIDFENGETEAQANEKFFGIKNKNDAFEKAELTIGIDDFELGEYTLYFYDDWGTLHIDSGELKHITY